MNTMPTEPGAELRIVLVSLHGLVRGENPELGRDEDTGGQVRYVLELARALARRPEVRAVELITRQIIDERVSTDYARLEEPIADRATIVRIPFGPKRYLRKTRLWPYLDMFVDQCLNYFQRTRRIPDIIHGHYADAGYGGAQLARLLGVPFIFTGHSLGRVKRERLVAAGVSEEKLQERYAIRERIEAEEFALETCSLICTSTHQEVKEQYERYENYIPERMEVIPPGVDLAAFHPPRPDDEEPAIAGVLRGFLHDPEKPVILAMARPDERKNLEVLVQLFGESPRLQKLANLLLIMGSRDDLREMPPLQRSVISNILTLIDVYDLYGKVAYPKHHAPAEVPSIYRLVTRLRGVFINNALTEPFGLTLLEAAASGTPVIATNDGGPRDIIANCNNGLLIDPLDPAAAEKALLRALTEPAQWDAWSRSGLEQVHTHYSWDQHTRRYLRNLVEIHRNFDITPTIIQGRRTRRMPQVDRIILADMDNTLTGDDEAMRAFFALIAEAGEKTGFGIATGRRYEDVMEFIGSHDIPRPEVLITSVGTEIYYGRHFIMDKSWQRHIRFRWEPEKIRSLLDGRDGFALQDEHEQTPWKISYKVDFNVAPDLAGIKRILREHKIRANMMVSHNIFLDVIPVRAGSGLAVRHIAWKWGFPLEHIMIAGDSGNDEAMLTGNTLGVVVGNFSPELERIRGYPRVYFAQGRHAAGIIEGIQYYHFLDVITIPNDRSNANDA